LIFPCVFTEPLDLPATLPRHQTAARAKHNITRF
jgi:hypothetical protein